MQIDESDKHFEKAASSMRKSLLSDSNATIERDRHLARQFRPNLLTEKGMQIRARMTRGMDTSASD
jgi:hypothetical protein